MKNYDSDYKLPRSSWFKRFLWASAGGDRFLLERATYSDQVKYMCLGGIVVATGLMASMSGGYAFYTIFSPKVVNVLNETNVAGTGREAPIDLPTVAMSVIFGIIWGLIIFNIDRFIVAATGKGDGTEKITWGEFKGAIPRILMGTIIAITISKPVEIRMFKSEIDAKLAEYQNTKKTQSVARVRINFKGKKEDVLKSNEAIQKQISVIDENINKLTTDIANETMGKNSANPGYGERAKYLQQQKDNEIARKNTLLNTPEYKAIQLEIDKQNQLEKVEIANEEKKAAAEDGLLRRIQLADEVSSTDAEGKKHFPWITTFITLLFLAIELTPVFFKLMLIKSPYDYLKDNLEDEIRARNGIEVKYDYYQDQKGLERHLVINHDADNLIFEKQKLSEIQKELTEYAIQKYKEREKQNIDDNLDEYVIKNVDPNLIRKNPLEKSGPQEEILAGNTPENTGASISEDQPEQTDFENNPENRV